MQVNEWLSTQLAQDIWKNKYQYNNEAFDEWLDRVSNRNEKIKQLIREKKFLFGGRILANRGLHKKGVKVTYSNCFVLSPPEDNIESIFDTAKNMARTFSYGGGVGIDIGKLRPKNAKVNNTARETTGSVSFMELYSMTTDLIGQFGRRGALMISIPSSHPDLEEFIDIKTDLNKVTKANISIRVSDDFLDAVKDDKDWELIFNVPETNEKIIRKVKAKDIFHKFAKNNWDYAEPAFLYWDRIENWNLLSEDKEFKYSGVNPCFTGDMKLLTNEGYKAFNELCNKNINIVNVDGEISEGKVWCSGEKKTVVIKLSDKSIIKCTPNHIFMTIDGYECMAKDLKGKKIMPLLQYENILDEEFIKLGFIQGDGQLGRLLSQHHLGLEVNIGYKDGDIFDLFSNESFTKKSERVIYLNGYNDKLLSLGFSTELLPNREMPSTYNNWTIKQKASFLQGCYSANGSVIKNKRLSYKTTCKTFAKQLLGTLKNDFNIGAYIATNKSHKVLFSNGEYMCKESYDINICKYKDIQKFHQHINFYQLYKRVQLQNVLKERALTVTSVRYGDIEKVYDFTEPKRHWGVVEGTIVHNCAEEPLPAGGSCLLGSLNLSEFVVNPFTKDAWFDMDAFMYAIEQSVIALNEVLDEGLELLPLEEQKKSVSEYRQIGLGVMGIADMLIKLGYKYGSDDSLDFCSNIAFELIDNAIKTSAILANKYDVYKKYNKEAILNSQFFKLNTRDSTKELVEKYGLRNSQLLTIAPTGTLSTMLGISGGIEPIYANSYIRKTESLHDEDVLYKIYTPIVKKYMDAYNIDNEEDLPDIFTTAMTLYYKDRINMQSVWQHYIDASISSTVNLNKNATVKDVEDLYMYAWEKGLKGITVFRDGCKRMGILTIESEEYSESNCSLDWGTVLESSDDLIGKKRKLVTGCGSLHTSAFFDPITGDLRECYLSKGSKGGCNNFMIGLSRMISLSARAGVHVDEIIEQLNSCGTCPSYAIRASSKKDTSKGSCCPIAIGNALRGMQNEMYNEFGIIENDNYNRNAQNNDINNNCPKCNEMLINEGGCVQCKSCGWSKCD